MAETFTALILSGPQGSGKTTQAKRLVAENGWQLIETGQLLRDEKASGSELGKRAAAIIDGGQLVPDEMSWQVVEARLNKLLSEGVNKIIFDGFPRTVGQAQPLIDFLIARQARVVLLVIEADLENCRARLLARGRHDDTPELITKRFTWHQVNRPAVESHLIKTLSPRQVAVDGNKPEDKVFAQISESVGD